MSKKKYTVTLVLHSCIRAYQKRVDVIKNARKTVIALDYDDTISLVPLFFKDMIEKWKYAIDFYIVTYRDTNAYTNELREFEELVGHDVIFTNKKAKIDHIVDVDIWVDNEAFSITHNRSANGTYELCDSQKKEVYRKVCKFNWDKETTRCHEIIVDNILAKGFKFCPYCGGELV